MKKNNLALVSNGYKKCIGQKWNHSISGGKIWNHEKTYKISLQELSCTPCVFRLIYIRGDRALIIEKQYISYILLQLYHQISVTGWGLVKDHFSYRPTLTTDFHLHLMSRLFVSHDTCSYVLIFKECIRRSVSMTRYI